MPLADLVIRNARVQTMDPAHPAADAIAVRGERIVVVGTIEEVLGHVGPRTQQIDAGGRTVLPGIIDSHNHVRLGATTNAVSLFGAGDLDEIRRRLAEHLRTHPDAEWIEGDGWNYQAVPGGQPTADMIDEACGGHPAWLFSYDVHTVWLNTAALARFGATGPDAEVPFGTFELDPTTRRPTGWVHDFAVKGIHPRGQRALEATLPGYSPDAQYHRLVENLQDAIRYGITTIIEPQNGLTDIALFTRARAAGELRSRLIAAIIHTPADDPGALAEIAEAAATHSGDHFRLGPVKLYIDDVVEPHTAAMLSPYTNAPDTVGATFWGPAEFAEVIVRLERLGLQAFVHGTGDRGIRTALNGFAAAQAENGPADTRHQIVHVECLAAADIPRFRELGVVACMQPRHCAPGLVGDWRANVGIDRERYAWAMRSLRDAGATLAFSSDWNVAEMDPMIGIYTALTRADLDGQHAWNLAETVDLGTALRAYTAGGAYANFADDRLGRIVEGALADLVVLSRDLGEQTPAGVLTTTVTHTIVDGDVVYRSADATS